MTALDLTDYRLTFDDEFNNRSISQNGAGTTWADIRREWRFDANSDIGFGNSSFLDAGSGYDPFNVQNGGEGKSLISFDLDLSGMRLCPRLEVRVSALLLAP
jgi:hypothetical protein